MTEKLVTTSIMLYESQLDRLRKEVYESGNKLSQSEIIRQALEKHWKGEGEMEKKNLIGKPYSLEICEGYDWDGFYPVVSEGTIIDIYDIGWGDPSEYTNKPVVNDEYIDADAEDEIDPLDMIYCEDE